MITDATRVLTHSFPRPKRGESPSSTMDRAILILRSIREVGLVLAPEVIDWDLEKMVPGSQPLRLLQKRLCLTEISPSELSEHSKIFGPLAITFDAEKAREAGALPVIYIPQAGSTSLSLLGLFCVNGAHHTKAVLGQLQQLNEWTDPEEAKKAFGNPLADDCLFTLNNSDAAGEIVASHEVPAIQIRRVLQHVGFNNIPFEHSIAVLGVFLNMFCPTDNLHQNEKFGYYKQREWRLINSDIRFNGRPMGRDLTLAEKSSLTAIDSDFWNRTLEVDGKLIKRQDLAVIYEPTEEWSSVGMMNSIYAPSEAVERVQEAIGDGVLVLPRPHP